MESEMQQLFLKFKLELDNQTKEITSKLTEKFDEKLQPIVEENKKLKSEINYLEKKVAWLEKDKKRNNIIIFGVEESEKSNNELIAKVTSEINKLQVKLSKHEINSAYRIGKEVANSEKSRPIVVTLVNTWKRNEILNNKKRSKDIYISEDFPKDVLEKRRKLQAQMHEERNKGNFAYIKYDKLIIKNKNQKKYDKRKRAPSTTPSASPSPSQAPRIENATMDSNTTPVSKFSKVNAFDVMRARSQSAGHVGNK